MTPEERVRADEITADIERFVKDRKKAAVVTIPGISPKPPAPTIRPVSQERPAISGNGLRYALIFILILTLHAAGFMAYTRHMEAKEQEMQAAMAAAIREATAQAEQARAEAERLTTAFTAQQAQLRPQLSGKSTPAVNPEIEYNTYKEKKPLVRKAVLQEKQPVVEEQPDRSGEHTSMAAAYLSRKGIYARSVSTTQISGWEGRYRTEFEVPRNTYTTGTTSPRPKRYEVITEEKGGKITALEYTTKGYY